MTAIRTYSGKTLDFLTLRADAICLTDIAHALAHVPRYCGHTTVPYSVAQHCVLMARMVEPGPLRAALLLHDATEAYMQDIPSPLKALLPNYQRIEAALWSVIAERFGVDRSLEAQVHHLDRVMLSTEMHAMFTDNLPEGLPPPAIGVDVSPIWGCVHARASFLREAGQLVDQGWLKTDEKLFSDAEWFAQLRASTRGTPVERRRV